MHACVCVCVCVCVCMCVCVYACVCVTVCEYVNHIPVTRGVSSPLSPSVALRCGVAGPRKQHSQAQSSVCPV